MKPDPTIARWKEIILAYSPNPEQYATIITGLEIQAHNLRARGIDMNALTTCLMVVGIAQLIERDGVQGAAYWLSRCSEVLLGDEPEAGTH